MYRIFLHILVLSLLEIIFYFNYVGPLETKMFKESFKGPTVQNSDDSIYIDINTSNIYNNVTKKYQDLSDMGKYERNKYNNDLYKSTFKKWGIFLCFTIFIILVQFYIYHYKKKDDNYSNDIEMQTFDNINLINNDINSNNDTIIQNNYQYLVKNKLNLFLNIVYFIFLFGFILLFEYLFFQFIILKYRIISKQELEFLIIQTYLPVLNNYISSNNINFNI